MKAFLKIFWITILIAMGSSFTLHAQVYVRQGTTMTISIENLNGVPSNYTWSVSPAITGFASQNSTSLSVKWSGNTDSLYTLTVQPTAISGCDGDPKSLSVKLFNDTSKLPIKVGWGVNPSPFCPIDTSTGDSIVVNGQIYISGYTGPYTITYRIDNDPVETVNLSTDTLDILTFKRGWNNFSESDYVYHYIRITRIQAGSITQLYSDADAPLLTITINPVPVINDIEYEIK